LVAGKWTATLVGIIITIIIRKYVYR